MVCDDYRIAAQLFKLDDLVSNFVRFVADLMPLLVYILRVLDYI